MDDYQTYFVGISGILVHNAGPCPFNSMKDVEEFASQITKFNSRTDGGGVLLNGDPVTSISSALYYEDVAEQGAAIFRSISHGHMFANGNKRTSVMAWKGFAKKAGIKNNLTDSQLMNISTKVATGEVTSVPEIAKLLTQ